MKIFLYEYAQASLKSEYLSATIIWFFSLYYSDKLQTISVWRYITAPLSFLMMQLGLIAGTLLIFFVNKIAKKSELKIRTDMDKNAWFLIILTIVPIIILFIMTLSTGSNVRPQWGYLFWYMIGIILFYFIPTDTNGKDFINIVKSSYIVMLIIFLSFGTMLVVEKSYRSRYPAVQVCDDFNKMWESEFHSPLKYIGGLIDFTYPITIYGKSHPVNIMETYGYDNIWINQNDLQKHGALIISKYPGELRNYVKSACPYLPDNIEVKPKKYKFELVNALGLSRKYKMYYFMVPPVGKFK